MAETVLWFLVFSFALQVWRQARHIRSLRRQLGPDGIDTWALRCHCCGRSLRHRQALLCTERRVYTDGRAEHTVVRAWHADRPRCSVAFAADPRVMDDYLNGDPL